MSDSIGCVKNSVSFGELCPAPISSLVCERMVTRFLRRCQSSPVDTKKRSVTAVPRSGNDQLSDFEAKLEETFADPPMEWLRHDILEGARTNGLTSR